MNDFNYSQRQELKALSKSIFNTSSFWNNKILKKYPLYTFEQVKEHMLKVQADTAAYLQKMKQSTEYDTKAALTLQP